MSEILSRLRSGSWLDAQRFAPLSWAVPGLIPEGLVLFTGPPKAGKSWAALAVSLAVASGGRAFGTIPVGRPRPVLLLALEDGDRRLQGRCRALLGPDEPIPTGLDYLTRATPAEVLEVIEAWLTEHGHAAPLIVLDTLGRVMPPALPGEGAYQRDYRVGAKLKAYADAWPGTCLMVVHHVRKQALGDGADWMDGTSGTNGLNGAADATVNIARPRNESAGILRVTGRDVPEGEYAITTAAGTWTLDGATLDDASRAAAQARVTSALGDRSAEIVAFVAAAPGPVNAADVVAALGIADARTYLSRLAVAGRLTRSGRGLYTPVASVASLHPDTPATHPVIQGNGETQHATHATGVLEGIA